MRVAFAADHAGAAFKDELHGEARALLPGSTSCLTWVATGPTSRMTTRTSRGCSARRSSPGTPTAGSWSAGPGSGRPSPSTRCAASGPAVCHDIYSAHQGVEHDDMNVLAMGARVIGIEPAAECAVAFLDARFSGEPRHQRRLDKVLAIEASSMGEEP